MIKNNDTGTLRHSQKAIVMPLKKYLDFKESEPVKQMAKHFAKHGDDTRLYVSITCPHCHVAFVQIPSECLASNKAMECLRHLRVCERAKAAGVQVAPRKRRAVSVAESDASSRATSDTVDRASPSTTSIPSNTRSSLPSKSDKVLVTIYALIFIPTNTIVYTGRTKQQLHDRFSQHGSRKSNCRLVRNAFRKHGRKAFRIEPIMRCDAEVGAVNETHWIIKNNTLHPNGYNLRHGDLAGEEFDNLASAIVPACTGIVPFNGVADEARACAEAWGDVAEMTEELDNTHGDVDGLCKELLKQVHPDAHGSHSKSFSAHDVAAMLNAVRETSGADASVETVDR